MLMKMMMMIVVADDVVEWMQLMQVVRSGWNLLAQGRNGKLDMSRFAAAKAEGSQDGKCACKISQ